MFVSAKAVEIALNTLTSGHINFLARSEAPVMDQEYKRVSYWLVTRYFANMYQINS